MLTIRQLNAADAADFKALRLQAVQTSPSAFARTHEEEACRPLENIAAQIQPTATQTVFGAFHNQTLVAITGVRRESMAKVRHKAMIWGVFVDPSHRRQSIAQPLLQAASEHAGRQWGCLQLSLCVNTQNTAARQLYAAQGFATYGVEPQAMLVDGCFHDEEHMWKALN